MAAYNVVLDIVSAQGGIGYKILECTATVDAQLIKASSRPKLLPRRVRETGGYRRFGECGARRVLLIKYGLCFASEFLGSLSEPFDPGTCSAERRP